MSSATTIKPGNEISLFVIQISKVFHYKTDGRVDFTPGRREPITSCEISFDPSTQRPDVAPTIAFHGSKSRETKTAKIKRI